METNGKEKPVTMNELEKLLGADTVVGEAIVVGSHTIIPLVSIGFGFGSGDGADAKTMRGGGGGIKPVAVIIVGEEGVRVEPVKSSTSAIDGIAEIASKVAQAYGKKNESE